MKWGPGADVEDIKATYDNGILKIRVGVEPEKSEPKQIPVTAA